MLQRSTKLKVTAATFIPEDPYWICPEEEEMRWNYDVLKANLDESLKQGNELREEWDELENCETESISTLASLFTQSSKDSGRIDLSTAERRLEQRQKQIDYGKNTVGYKRYIEAVPKSSRRFPDPETPERQLNCSKRAWDGLVRKWRRQLHHWDPPELK